MARVQWSGPVRTAFVAAGRPGTVLYGSRSFGNGSSGDRRFGFQHGEPKALFKLPSTASLSDAMPDGNRFLVIFGQT